MIHILNMFIMLNYLQTMLRRHDFRITNKEYEKNVQNCDTQVIMDLYDFEGV